MKKLLALLLAMAMVLALVACGGSDNSAPANSQPANSQTDDSTPTEDKTPDEPTVEPITLRIAYMPNYASLWAVLSGINGGFFAEEGITVELTEFGDGPSEIAAMEGGAIDLAYIGKGAHRLCILGNATIFAPSSVHTSDTLIVTAESGIETVEDLRGKKIGYSAGSSSESTMNSALALAGLTHDDVELFNLEPGYIVPAMISGTIDVAVTWSPYTFQILESVEGTKEIEFADGSTNMSSWICLPDYAAENRDTLVRFSRALYKAMDWGSNPDNAEQVAGWVAAQCKIDEASALLQWGDAEWFDIPTMKAAIADGTMKAYYEGVQNDMIAGGNIEASDARNVEEFVMLDVMEEALNQVG